MKLTKICYVYIMYIHLRINLKKCGSLYYKLNKYIKLIEISYTYTLFINHNENIKRNKLTTEAHNE